MCCAAAERCGEETLATSTRYSASPAFRLSGFQASDPKLPEMMIHVEIPPPHPRRLRHRSEDRMHPPVERADPGQNAIDLPFERRDVRVEVGRFRPTDLLIDFRARQNPRWPRGRQIQRGPFHDGALRESGREAH